MTPKLEDWGLQLERALDGSEFRRMPFAAGDLNQIERQDLTKRIALLCLFGLWHKVPADRWLQWLEEVDLAMPFPPDGFSDLDTQSEKEECLAGPLGLSKATVTQLWYRGPRILATLECIRSLQS